MRSIIKRLITLMVVVAVTISFVTPVMAEYDNSRVYTTIDDVKYYMNGTKLMKDGKKVVNFQELTCKDGDKEITEDMMKTLLVTDLTHDEYKGHDIIYAVGLVFRPEQDKLDSSDDFKDGKIKIGVPYLVVMSYSLDGKLKDVPWYKDLPLMMEAVMQYDPIWDGEHDVRLNEGQDPTEDESYDTLYNFAAKVVQPRIIMSTTESHRAYIIAQDVPDDNVPYEHVKLFSFYTDRALKPEQKFSPEFYATFWWLDEKGKQFGNYNVRLDRFYIKELSQGHVVMYNFGDNMSIAIEMDITYYGRPLVDNVFWQENEKLDIDK
jgi:hypothetical protein